MPEILEGLQGPGQVPEVLQEAELVLEEGPRVLEVVTRVLKEVPGFLE